MALIKRPIKGEGIIHLKEVWCPECRRVTEQTVQFIKYVDADRKVIATAICQRERFGEEVYKGSAWKHEHAPCGHATILSLTVTQWEGLTS